MVIWAVVVIIGFSHTAVQKMLLTETRQCQITQQKTAERYEL